MLHNLKNLPFETPHRAFRLLALSALAMLFSQSALAQAKLDSTPQVTEGSGEATLVRTKNHLSISGVAEGLIPGNAYTVWWIVIDPTGDVVVANATGNIVNSAGEGRFGAALPTGTYEAGETPQSFVLVSGSLTDPLNATVILQVVDHGAPDPEYMPAQISEISAAACPVGCPLFTEMIFAP